MFLSITVHITAVWPYLPASLEDAIILLSVANVHLFVRSDVARSVSRTVRSAPLVIQKLTKFRRVQLTPDYLPPSLPPRGPGFILSGFRQLRKALPVPSPLRTSLSRCPSSGNGTHCHSLISPPMPLADLALPRRRSNIRDQLLPSLYVQCRSHIGRQLSRVSFRAFSLIAISVLISIL